MPRSRIEITIDEELLLILDRLVRSKVFPSRSQAFQLAMEETLERMRGGEPASECVKLDPGSRQVPADEAPPAELERWPSF